MYFPPALTAFASLSPAQAPVSQLDANFTNSASLAMVHGGYASGTANGLTLSIPLVMSDYPLGLKVSLQALSNNTSAATLSVNGLSPIALTDIAGTALTPNALIAGNLYLFTLCADQAGNLTFRQTGIGAGNTVSTVFGRTGAITANSGDYTIGQIAGAGTMASQNANAVTITGGVISGVTLNVGVVAKAWAAYNGVSQTVLSQFNVGSINRTSQGFYTVNFGTAFADTNYAFMATASDTAAGRPLFAFQHGALTTTSCAFEVVAILSDSSLIAADSNQLCVAFFHL